MKKHIQERIDFYNTQIAEARKDKEENDFQSYKWQVAERVLLISVVAVKELEDILSIEKL